MSYNDYDYDTTTTRLRHDYDYDYDSDKDIGIRKFEIVAKSQFLKPWTKTLLIPGSSS